MSKIRAGIVGCGGIANGKHLPSIRATGEVELVAFCDIILERAQEACKTYGAEGAKVYEDYKELLKDDSIEAVYVCTPNRSHSFISIDALDAGKHVMCEKPMAKTYAEAMQMVEAAKRNNRVLTIGYQNRRTAASLYIKQAAEAGDLGDIYYAKAHAVRRRAVPTWGVFLNEYEQGGGPLIDIGTHALDLTLWCMNNYKPRMVVGTSYRKLADQTDTGNAWGDWDPKEFTVEDSCFGFIVMENGATISLESSWALNTLDVIEASTTLCGTEGGADMRDGVRINGVRHGKQYTLKPDLAAGGVAFYDGASGKPEEIESKMFVDAIRKGTEPSTLPEQAAVVTRILEAIYESAKTGKPVYLND